jgi:hypothetical protein
MRVRPIADASIGGAAREIPSLRVRQAALLFMDAFIAVARELA